MPRGRSGRALTAWLTRDADKETGGPTTWRRIPVTAPGVELHVDGRPPRSPGSAPTTTSWRRPSARQSRKLLPHGT